MKDLIQYKDFIGSVHFSTDDEVFFGKIEGINDLITFEGNTVAKLKESFTHAVDDYIAICNKMGKKPYKSFKGSFNVRINPELHKKAVFKAQIMGISLNQFVQKAIEDEVINN